MSVTYSRVDSIKIGYNLSIQILPKNRKLKVHFCVYVFKCVGEMRGYNSVWRVASFPNTAHLYCAFSIWRMRYAILLRQYKEKLAHIRVVITQFVIYSKIDRFVSGADICLVLRWQLKCFICSKCPWASQSIS